jgi:hypothetical protein
MTTAEVAELISTSVRVPASPLVCCADSSRARSPAQDYWEALRGALESYAKYAWADDILEVMEESVVIPEDLCEERGFRNVLDAMLHMSDLTVADAFQPPAQLAPGGADDEWDRAGTRMPVSAARAKPPCDHASDALRAAHAGEACAA